MKGKVKFYNASKGYGFIAPDDGGGDVFVHSRELGRNGLHLKEGDEVSFDTEPDKRGRGVQAVNVKRA
jgi:CspA family cold shock protein